MQDKFGHEIVRGDAIVFEFCHDLFEGKVDSFFTNRFGDHYAYIADVGGALSLIALRRVARKHL